MMLRTFSFTLLFTIINFHLIKCGTRINKSFDIFLAPTLNDRPIIGVLSQEMSSDLARYADQYHSYIAASYVKYIEGAGARVVPVWIGKDRKYYEDIMSKLNGILFPGGGIDFNDTNGYAKAGSFIYENAIKLNENGDYFPLWGTCLGFELLAYLSANKNYILTECSAQSLSLPLKFKADFKTSRMFKASPKMTVKILKDEDVTANFHHFCLTEQSLKENNLASTWQVISINDDANGLKFISSFEHRQYPFYGVQFHPEKNLYEWIQNRNISHTSNAVLVSQYFAQYFVNETRKSGHHFEDLDDENRYLIYNYLPKFTGANGSPFEQTYLFTENVHYKLRTD